MMKTTASKPQETDREAGLDLNRGLDPDTRDPIHENVESIFAYYRREEKKLSKSQRALEQLSSFFGRPYYLIFILLFVASWALVNLLAKVVGREAFDPPPFFWLQGIVSLGALLTTTVVLVKQNRLGKLTEQRAHLDLQVNLLTEQKTTKLIALMEELRRDLPMVKNRHDPEVDILQQPTDPHQVLEALGGRTETSERRVHTRSSEHGD